MSEQIFYEQVDMPDPAVPVKIFCRHTDSNSNGCRFNWHCQMEFFYIVKGGLLLQCGRKSQWIYENDIGIVNCNEPHKSLKFLDNTTHYLIQIDVAGLFSGVNHVYYDKNLLPLINNEVGIRNFIVQNTDLNALFRTLVREFYDKIRGYELTINGYIYLIFAKLLRDFQIQNDKSKASHSRKKNLLYIADILSYIESHYTSEILLQDIANKLYVTVPHMCRLFKAETGISIVQYCNLLRCYRAKLALESGCSVTCTAEMFGFSDSNYFSRVFKKTYGISPSSVTRYPSE